MISNLRMIDWIVFNAMMPDRQYFSHITASYDEHCCQLKRIRVGITDQSVITLPVFEKMICLLIKILYDICCTQN